MKWLIRFLGIQDKEQKERTDQVARYVHDQKNTYTSEMGRIRIQARNVHNKTRKAHEESIRLLEIVDSVTAKIAIATGGRRRGLR